MPIGRTVSFGENGVLVLITVEMVKELRDLSGAKMMECKRVLQESDGDMKLALTRLLDGEDGPAEPEPEPVD
jgi:hypothetical protein